MTSSTSTTQTTGPEIAPEGEPVHFCGGGVSVVVQAPKLPGGTAWAEIKSHGEELVLTPELVEASRDRLGRSAWDLLDDEQGQINRWGEVKFRRGPWPANTGRHALGSLAWLEARDAARADVDRRPEAERPAAAAAVRAQYGAQATTSRTINSVR
jgi:hypothetical protein